VAPGSVVVDQFRFQGPQGTRDEFIELYNATSHEVVLPADGWALRSYDPAGGISRTLVVIPGATVLPAHGYYLLVNDAGEYEASPASQYPDLRLGEPVGHGDLPYSGDVAAGGGIALFRSATLFTDATRLDAVGFTGVAPLYREAAGLAPTGGITSNVEHAFVRSLTTGLPRDTGDNQADFAFVAPDGAAHDGRTAVLGSPGPRRMRSPQQRNALVAALPYDPSAAPSASPNQVRNTDMYQFGSACSATRNFAMGTLSLQRTFRNDTGRPLRRLRFRVVDITTKSSPVLVGPQADLRVLSSMGTVLATGNVPVTTVQGMWLEEPPCQGDEAGGLHSSLAVDLSGRPNGALLPGESVPLQFLLGVQASGKYRFFVNVETD
jgi:hypothetical protein